MKIYGIDFTIASSKAKAIDCAEAYLEIDILHIQKFYQFTNFSDIIKFLKRSPV